MPVDAISEKKGRALKALLDASKQEKKDFNDTGEEVEAFGHKADEKAIYDSLDVQADLWFRTTVALTAQAIDLICPYLYPANPYRCGKVRRSQFADPMVIQAREARNALMMEYLNYTPNETDLYGESVRAINQSQVYGMGVVWTGYNQRKKLVHSVYDTVDNLEKDPDAATENQVNWKARKREKQRWQLADMYPKAAQTIAAMKCSKTSKANLGKPSDLITYYEVYMRVGLHRYVEGGLNSVDPMTGEAITPDDAPKKYVVSDEGKLIDEGDWETPLFLDNLWPCSELSYIEDPESIWPVSPLRAALPFQKALNWLYIFYMTKIRFCSRSLFGIMDFGDTDLPADGKKALEMMNDLPFITMRTTNDQRKFSDVFQQLNLDPGLQNFELAHGIIKKEFQEHSGMYDILHYGEGDTQSRSATDTDFRRETSKTRINFRKDRVVKWQGEIARKEAQCARFLHTPEEIDNILGLGAGQIWGQIMPPAALQPQMGPMGEMIPPNPMGVDFQQWILETDYSIESTSMRRHDIDTKIEALKEQMNTVVPVQLQSMDLNEKAVAYDTIAEYQEAIGGSDDIIQKNRQLADQFRQQAQMMLMMQQQQMMMGGPPQPGGPIPGPGSQQPQQAGG